MEMYIKDNFFKENGMEEVKFFFQTQQFNKEFGYKIKSNDKNTIYLFGYLKMNK
jgi:hypothetical protein